MKYLLDTNICIAIIKQHPKAAAERLLSCQSGEVGVSSITVAELRYGATKSQSAAKNHQALDLFLLPIEIAHFDEDAAHSYGQVRVDLEKHGTPIGPLDTLIAAHAIALGTALVTNNTREFKRIKQLQLEDWT